MSSQLFNFKDSSGYLLVFTSLCSDLVQLEKFRFLLRVQFERDSSIVLILVRSVLSPGQSYSFDGRTYYNIALGTLELSLNIPYLSRSTWETRQTLAIHGYNFKVI